MTTSEERRVSAVPSPMDLPSFVPHVCIHLGAPFAVKIVKSFQKEYVSKVTPQNKKSIKSNKSLIQQQTSLASSASDTSARGSAASGQEEEPVVVRAVYDALGRLVELAFSSRLGVPRLLLQVLALCMPYQAHLSRITVRRVRLDGASLYEMSKLLLDSYLTELRLDDSPVPQRNYHLLFRDRMRLKILSLDRCDIDDEDAASIAAQLTHPAPGSGALLMLSLVANLIADAGAAALGAALRTNRTLQHLNLAGNRITDDGAAELFRCLTEFSLSSEELLAKRRRFLDYLIRKKRVYDECYRELTFASQEKSRDSADFSRGSKRKAAFHGASKLGRRNLATSAPPAPDPLAMRAATITEELLGAYSDPFGPAQTVPRGRRLHSLGNLTLRHLNVAYNGLGCESLARIGRVLAYQGRLPRGAARGLVQVVVEGNPLPAAGGELAAVQLRLEQIAAVKNAKPTPKRERERPRTKTGR